MTDPTPTANPARLLVRDAIAADQQEWNVVATANLPDAVVKPTALIWTGKLTRHSIMGGQFVQSTVELWLLPPAGLKPAELEDRGDAMLLAALDLIEATDSWTWTEAVRGAVDNVYHGWHLTLTVAHNLTKES